MRMNRRDFLGAFVAAAGAAGGMGGSGLALAQQAAAAAPAAGAGGQQRRPSFLVILCDDMGYGDLGCYGHPAIATPNLDRLAAQGARFTDCYCAQPVCSPSRAGLLTGRVPHRAGIDDWIPAGSPVHLRKGEVTLPQLLKQAGYATAHVGKWHCNGKFNNPEQAQPGDHGFDHWMSTQNNAGPSHKDPVNFVRNGRRVGLTRGYSSQVIVDEALAWLKTVRADQPFFLFVCFHATHEPVATAPEFSKPYLDKGTAKSPEQAEYFGNVTQMDHEVGRLLAALDESKRAQDTLVFFTSDNGPETHLRYPNAKRSHGSPGPFRGMKLHLYEGGVRVPGIVRWPWWIGEGAVVAEPVSALDLLPTACAAAGVAPPAGRTLDGTDLTPLLDGRPLVRRTPLFWIYDQALGGRTLAMRQGPWKLLADQDGRTCELYNLREDPGEKMDLAAREPQRLAEMKARLLELYRQVEAERPAWPAAAQRG